jgi:glycosyltransferase involved in cell wall biosynthesis
MSICNLLSIVIPCYNEEATAKKISQRIVDLARDLHKKGLLKNFELIFVNDGSQDNTLSILKNLAKENKTIKVLSLSRNFGHQAALTAGLYRAKGEAIVSLDADLQDPPEVIPEMLQKFAKGNEIVLAVRKGRKVDGFWKKITSKFFYRLMNLLGANLVLNHADFRLISRRVAEELKNFPERSRFLRGLIPNMGFNQSIVYYEREARFAGKTKYSFGKMLGFALDGITSFSYSPLRLASILGILIALGSLILTSWAIIINLLGKAVPGWTSTVLPMYFLGGIQLLFLGIIGEYIGKIYMESKKRPHFIIKEEHNFD